MKFNQRLYISFGLVTLSLLGYGTYRISRSSFIILDSLYENQNHNDAKTLIKPKSNLLEIDQEKVYGEDVADSNDPPYDPAEKTSIRVSEINNLEQDQAPLPLDTLDEFKVGPVTELDDVDSQEIPPPLVVPIDEINPLLKLLPEKDLLSNPEDVLKHDTKVIQSIHTELKVPKDVGMENNLEIENESKATNSNEGALISESDKTDRILDTNESINSDTIDSETIELPKRRKGLIIVAHGRSGSTFTLQVFNQNPLVFAAYEPMLLTEWWSNRSKRKKETFNQTEAVMDILTAFMTCTFSKHKHAINFLNEYSYMEFHRMVSAVFRSPPFCATAGKFETCIPLDPKQVDEACLSRPYSVVKIMYMRLPDQSINVLSHVLKRVENEVDMKLIHLVRDPRGNLNSRIHLHWIQDYPSPSFTSYAKQFCDLVEKNVKEGEKIPKDKYIFLNYKTIAGKPIEAAIELYGQVGFVITQDTLQWLKDNARPSRVDHWRNETSPGRTESIESQCQPLFRLLGIENDIYGKAIQ